MLDISVDLQVNQPTVTLIGNEFISIENYLSVLAYDVVLIKVKTKLNTVKICGDKLSIKYITDSDIGIKGIIHSVEYID